MNPQYLSEQEQIELAIALSLQESGGKVVEPPPNIHKETAQQDMIRYRKGYPDLKDDLSKSLNLQFYQNKISSKPNGVTIDYIHKNWFGNYELLEKNHTWVQWVFPIRERVVGKHAQPLQLHEAKAIIADKEAYARVLKSYELMLDFLGMKLKDAKSGEIERSSNWKNRYNELNEKWNHNFLRITRMLKCLGELGYEHLKYPFVEFVLKEIFENGQLYNALDAAENYWLETIKDDQKRTKLKSFVEKHTK